MMAENVSQMFAPNTAKMKEHLTFLFGSVPAKYQDGMIEISILNQSAYFPVTDIPSAVKQAADWNSQGYNVYTCGSILSPDVLQNIKKRKEAGGKSPRAEGADFYASNHVWVDIDDITEAQKQELKTKYAHCPPNYYVITGKVPSTRVHLWWELDQTVTAETVEKMELANKGLISNLFGDKGTHNRTRLMRLGGSVSWPKKNKTDRVTEIVECKATDWFPPHSLDQIIKAYPVNEEKPLFQPAPEYKPKHTNPFAHNSEWSLDDIQSLLDFIPPESGVGGKSGYYDWLQVGMALHDYGAPFEIWDNWCKRGACYPKQNEHSTYYKWNTFKKGGGVSLGSIVHRAKQGGWRPAAIEQRIERTISKMEPITEYDAETGEVQKEVQTNKFHYINAPDILIDLDVNDFVQGLLTENAMSVVYGESNCGKTFFMSDLAFHIAQGKKWNGKRVEKGNVLYLSLEGKRGIVNRIAAYKLENKVTLDGFLMMPCQVDFISSEDDIPQLIALVKQANSQFNDNIKMIVVDTLARAIGGGDENSGVDMGILVKHSDLIRQHTNAHICFIHHSGKDKAKGARGHSSLRAAVDTEIEISRTDGADYSTVKVPKQRDMERDDDFQFKLKRVVLGLNRHGEEVSSCIVEPYNIAEDVEARINKKAQKASIKKAYDATIECVSDNGVVRYGSNLPPVKTITYDDFKEGLAKRGLIELGTNGARSIASRIRRELTEADLIVCRDDFIWLKE